MGGRGGVRTHLVILTARLQQALLDGELQQIILILPQGILVRPHHAVPPRHLEQGWVHLTRAA